MNTGGSRNGHSSESDKKPRLQRTLIGVVVGALLAMSIVPYATHTGTYQYRRGYMPIYEIGGRENVNVAQLVLNISFAALAGALVSNLPRRAWRTLFWIVASVALLAVAFFGFVVFQMQMRTDAEREEGIGLWSDNERQL